MLTPNMAKGREIPVFRKQACRTYPFSYEKEEIGEGGYNTYRLDLQNNRVIFQLFYNFFLLFVEDYSNI